MGTAYERAVHRYRSVVVVRHVRREFHHSCSESAPFPFPKQVHLRGTIALSTSETIALTGAHWERTMRSAVIEHCKEWQSMKPLAEKGEKLVFDEERKICRVHYLFARLSGIYCVNELLERGCPSLPFKIYSIGVCVLSVIFSFTGLVSMIWPSFCPIHNRYLRQIQTHDKIIYIMMSVCCTMLRAVIVFKFCSLRWYRHLQRAVTSLRGLYPVRQRSNSVPKTKFAKNLAHQAWNTDSENMFVSSLCYQMLRCCLMDRWCRVASA